TATRAPSSREGCATTGPCRTEKDSSGGLLPGCWSPSTGSSFPSRSPEPTSEAGTFRAVAGNRGNKAAMTMPPKDLQPELALLARMRQGDEDAFVELYRRHKDAVYRLALLYSGSAAHASDATQETFVFFMTRPDQYDPLRGTLAAWLCGVARNIARKSVGGREDATAPEALADDTAPHEQHVDRD